MIRINLLPAQVVNQVSSQKKELGFAGGILAITLVGVGLAHFMQFSQLRKISAIEESLGKQVAEIHKQNQDLEKMRQQKKDLEDKARIVSLLTAPQRRTASVHILDDLSSSTPEFLWLTEFVETRGIAQIRGKAIDNQTIASFAHNLSSSQYFRNVEIRETQQEPQNVPSRNRSAKDEGKTAALSAMMTKFLIETGLNYGRSIPTAATTAEAQDSSKEQKKTENKTSTKATAAATASKAEQKE